MLKKTLFAFAAVAFLALAVQAHEDWPTTLIWQTKPGPTVPVKMKIVMWAEIYLKDPNFITLTQTDPTGTFEGCALLDVCVNFKGLKVMAEFVDSKVIKLKTDGKWYVSLVPCNTTRDFRENKTDVILPEEHLSDKLGCLELCVRATKVDPQSHMATAGQLIEVGVINLTMVPTLAP